VKRIVYYTHVNEVLLCGCTETQCRAHSGRRIGARRGASRLSLAAGRGSLPGVGAQLPRAIKLQEKTCI